MVCACTAGRVVGAAGILVQYSAAAYEERQRGNISVTAKPNTDAGTVPPHSPPSTPPMLTHHLNVGSSDAIDHRLLTSFTIGFAKNSAYHRTAVSNVVADKWIDARLWLLLLRSRQTIAASSV